MIVTFGLFFFGHKQYEARGFNFVNNCLKIYFILRSDMFRLGRIVFHRKHLIMN